LSCGRLGTGLGTGRPTATRCRREQSTVLVSIKVKRVATSCSSPDYSYLNPDLNILSEFQLPKYQFFQLQLH
jgi:hypothetical protein